jgi:hypothetical protein
MLVFSAGEHLSKGDQHEMERTQISDSAAIERLGGT